VADPVVHYFVVGHWPSSYRRRLSLPQARKMRKLRGTETEREEDVRLSRTSRRNAGASIARTRRLHVVLGTSWYRSIVLACQITADPQSKRERAFY
jgi:hypothetical protein